MKIYPFNYPLILNDDIFSTHGGQTGTSTAFMRTAAYVVAEQQMTTYLDAFLLPTTVTGTWDYVPFSGFLGTEYGYVSAINDLAILDHNGNILKTLPMNGNYNFIAIREDTFGYLYYQDLLWYFQCPPNLPYKFRMAYTSGLPTGMASQPGMLIALSKAAQLTLNELYSIPANEGVGDVGIEDFHSLDYSEKRKPWKNTAFGSSPSAAYIAHMVDSTVKKARRALMLGSGYASRY